MTQHFSRNTVSASFWCGKCQRFTQHRIDRDGKSGRKGPCLGCIAKLEVQRVERQIEHAEHERQKELFG